jgi:hypothetical protein
LGEGERKGWVTRIRREEKERMNDPEWERKKGKDG